MDKFVDFCSSVFTNLSSLKNGTNDIESYLMKEDPSLYKKIGTFQINYDTFLLDLKNYSHKLQTESKELINNLSDDLTALDLLNVTNLIDDNVKPYIERAEALQLEAKDISFVIKDIAQKLEQQEKDEEVPDDAPWWAKVWSFVKKGFKLMIPAIKMLAELAWGVYLNPYLQILGLSIDCNFSEVIANLGTIIIELFDEKDSLLKIATSLNEIKVHTTESNIISNDMRAKLSESNETFQSMTSEKKNKTRLMILDLVKKTLDQSKRLSDLITTHYFHSKQ